MKNYRVKKNLENTYRMMRGEISRHEMERLNREAEHPQLSLGIGAATEPPRRRATA